MEVDNQVNLNYLRIFIEVAECNSFQEVADKFGYDYSNISSTIKKFEDQLGVQLFTRNPLKLTEIGRDIYNSAVNGYREIDAINVIAKSKNDMTCGKITIGCPLNLTKYYLMNSIVNVQRDYPNFQITVDCESNYKEIVKKIRNNDIQFALLDFTPPEDSYIKGLKIEKLYDSEHILVANKEIIIKNIDELNNYKYITSENNRFTTIDLKECFKKHNIKLKQSIICVITEARIEAAKNGLGIAYVLKDSVKKELNRKELYEVKVPIKLPKTIINLIYIKDRLTKVDKKFIKEYLK